MTASITLQNANDIIDAVFKTAQSLDLNPLAVSIVDKSGGERAFQAQDGTSSLRPKIAYGKAYGAVGLGVGSRAIFKRAQEQPFFVDAINTLADGALVPVPGGVLIKNGAGDIVGAAGVTGDTSDNDERAAIAGIEAAGFVADPG